MTLKKALFCFWISPFISGKAQLPKNVPIEGLKAYWSFSGNVNDQSGNKHHGVAHGVRLTLDRFGNKNSAYDFDGIGNYIVTGYKGVLGVQSRSVSFWLKTKSKKNFSVVNWGKDSFYPDNGHRFDCSFNYYKQGATINLSDAGITFEPHSFISDGKWHHYVFTFDKPVANKVEIYQDGNLLTHEAVRFYPNTRINTLPNLNITLGAISLDNDKTRICYLEGQLDDIAIYERKLTQAEIINLFEDPAPERWNVILRWIIIILSVALVLTPLIVLIIRRRYKYTLLKEQAENKMRNAWFEQENRVLKAQMDPHFVFNSLNAIQQFIIVNENEKAQLYLTKFSRLIRKILESNTVNSMLLQEEIDLLGQYLEIETLRFNTTFAYRCVVKDGLDAECTHIPHFMIQPFIENAIWHGLLPKDGDKTLTLTFEKIDEKTLSCTIEDDGVGRQQVKRHELLENKKSLAINFIKQRLLLMSKMMNSVYNVEITDKTNLDGSSAGTLVKIILPILKPT